MNILYIAHRIPFPPDKGEKIRAFHQICQLAAAAHTVHVACLIDDPRDFPAVAGLREHCASLDHVLLAKRRARLLAAGALLGRSPLSVAGFGSRALARKIDARLRTTPIDRIFVYSSQMAQYVSGVSHIPRVIDFVDVDSDKWRLYAEHHRFPLSWVYRLESRRLAAYEERVARSFDGSILVTEREARLLRRRVPDHPISVVANGVDLEYWKPGPPRAPAEPVLVFTGVMNYLPNVDAVEFFCREVLPIVAREEPRVRFFVVGRNPSRRVQALGQSNVVITGEVPDVRPYLAQAAVAVAPMRISRGVQNKILEAMAAGLPVVTTTEAIGGTEATAGDGVRVADAPGEFAARVLELLRDDALRADCARRARQYVERCHSWQRHGSEVERLLREVAPGPAS